MSCLVGGRNALREVFLISMRGERGRREGSWSEKNPLGLKTFKKCPKGRSEPVAFNSQSSGE